MQPPQTAKTKKRLMAVAYMVRRPWLILCPRSGSEGSGLTGGSEALTLVHKVAQRGLCLTRLRGHDPCPRSGAEGTVRNLWLRGLDTCPQCGPQGIGLSLISEAAANACWTSTTKAAKAERCRQSWLDERQGCYTIKAQLGQRQKED